MEMPDHESLEKEVTLLRERIIRKEMVEQAMEEIAIQFIKPTDLDESINFALEKLLELSGSDRALIMQVNQDDHSLLSSTHERCRKGVRPAFRYTQNLVRQENKWFQKISETYGYIAVNNSALLPDEAATEKKIFKKSRIGASLIASFASNNEFRGNLNLICRKPIEKWEPEIIRMVIFIAVLIEHKLERKEAQEKLITAKERAEQSDRMKSAFMANLSHEIRTPLNGILGFTRLMNRNKFNENKIGQYAKLIEKSSDHLLSIIDDLIDLSRIESDSINLVRREVNLKDVLRSTYESFSVNLPGSKDIRLKLELPVQEESLILLSDPRRLRQIIDNLMKNAIRYTAAGIITLGYRVRKKKVNIFVRDTGIGIEKENLSNVFNRFWQVDHSHARTYGGSGLGLSISKDFARMLGGDIHVKSKPGKGSEFTLELPL